MPITYAGGEMRHPADRIAKQLGPVASEIWEMRKGAWPEGDWRPGMDTDGNELDWTKIDKALDAEERRLGRPLTMREIAEISSPILAQM